MLAASVSVDTSSAGHGELDVGITHCKHKINYVRESCTSGVSKFVFTPLEAGAYDVEVTFNDQPIPGECWFLMLNAVIILCAMLKETSVFACLRHE